MVEKKIRRVTRCYVQYDIQAHVTFYYGIIVTLSIRTFGCRETFGGVICISVTCI